MPSATADRAHTEWFLPGGLEVRVKSMTIVAVVLAAGAVPAMAAKQTALRSLPRALVTVPVVAAPAPSPSVVVRPSAVWIPSPSFAYRPARGIKWGGTATKPARRR